MGALLEATPHPSCTETRRDATPEALAAVNQGRRVAGAKTNAARRRTSLWPNMVNIVYGCSIYYDLPFTLSSLFPCDSSAQTTWDERLFQTTDVMRCVSTFRRATDDAMRAAWQHMAHPT